MATLKVQKKAQKKNIALPFCFLKIEPFITAMTLFVEY